MSCFLCLDPNNNFTHEVDKKIETEKCSEAMYIVQLTREITLMDLNILMFNLFVCLIEILRFPCNLKLQLDLL